MGVKGKIKRALIVVILAVLAIVTIFPIWFLIVNSFKGQQEIVASPIALPKSWNLDYLKNAAEQINLGSSLLQTVLITVAAVALIVVISSFAHGQLPGQIPRWQIYSSSHTQQPCSYLSSQLCTRWYR